MRTTLPALFALLVAGCAGTASTPLPQRDVPQGMRALETGGSGQVFTTTLNGSPSATAMTQALLRGMQPYFDNSAQIVNAIGDQTDTQIQASFRATLQGVPVFGLIGVAMQGTAARAFVMFDERTALPNSVDRLMRVATGESGGAGGAPAAPPVALTRTQVPDGSGTIDLGPGWVIRFAQKGAMDIQGPLPGSGMSLGAVAPIPAVSLDPAEAIVQIADGLARMQGKTVQTTVLDSRPIDWQQGGRASLLRYRVVSDGKTMEYFGLIGITPFEPGQVFLYTSIIQAPPESFAQVLPVALRSWASWSIYPSTLASRMQQTAQTMRETGELLTGANANQQRAFDGVNAGWGQYVRGVATLEIDGQSRSEVDQRFADNVVQNDPQHFRIVPTNELVP